MRSDIDLFIEYDREIAGSYNKAYHALELLRNSISSEIVELLDLELCTNSINDIIKYLYLKKRYVILKSLAPGKLSVSKDGFKLYDNTYMTMDEVERAFKNKAFL